MSGHTQLQVLQKEAKVLHKLHTKLSDQLNRLKVEELALLSQIRASQVSTVGNTDRQCFQPPKEEEEEDTKHNASTINEQPLLDLEASNIHEDMRIEQNIMEEDEEDDEEEYDEDNNMTTQDELAIFLKGLENQTQM